MTTVTMVHGKGRSIRRLSNGSHAIMRRRGVFDSPGEPGDPNFTPESSYTSSSGAHYASNDGEFYYTFTE